MLEKQCSEGHQLSVIDDAGMYLSAFCLTCDGWHTATTVWRPVKSGLTMDVDKTQYDLYRKRCAVRTNVTRVSLTQYSAMLQESANEP